MRGWSERLVVSKFKQQTWSIRSATVGCITQKKGASSISSNKHDGNGLSNPFSPIKSTPFSPCGYWAPSKKIALCLWILQFLVVAQPHDSKPRFLGLPKRLRGKSRCTTDVEVWNEKIYIYIYIYTNVCVYVNNII